LESSLVIGSLVFCLGRFVGSLTSVGRPASNAESQWRNLCSDREFWRNPVTNRLRSDAVVA